MYFTQPEIFSNCCYSCFPIFSLNHGRKNSTLTLKLYLFLVVSWGLFHFILFCLGLSGIFSKNYLMNVKKQEMLWNKTHKKENCIEIEKIQINNFHLMNVF